MFSKRMLLLIIGALLLWVHAAFADTESITATQTTLTSQMLGSVASCGVLCTTEVTITITNGTNKTWTDYSILFVDALGTNAEVDITVKGFQRGKPWSALSIEGDGTKQAVLTLSKGSVPPGGTFTIVVDLMHRNSVNVFGTPSIPEPSSSLLFGTGLVGLAGVLRRKLHT